MSVLTAQNSPSAALLKPAKGLWITQLAGVYSQRVAKTKPTAMKPMPTIKL